VGILFGLTAAVAWAAADFLARHVSRRIGPLRAFISMQWFGLAVLTIYLTAAKPALWMTLASPLSGPARDAWEWACVAGILNIVASVSLYRAFAIGKLALVTPIAASYPALTVVLALASGERLKIAAGAGIAVVLAGVMLTVIPAATAAGNSGLSPDKAERGLGWALTAALGFGVMFWLLGFRVTPVLGGALPVWLMRLMGALVVVVLPLCRRTVPVIPGGNIWWLLAASALLDTTAFVANNMGLALGHVSVVTVLASLFGPLAVLLAWIFLGERLSRRQWFGVTLIFLGVALVSI
jgi:drug/metabolite transporter (DMT)-like permease